MIPHAVIVSKTIKSIPGSSLKWSSAGRKGTAKNFGIERHTSVHSPPQGQPSSMIRLFAPNTGHPDQMYINSRSSLIMDEKETIMHRQPAGRPDEPEILDEDEQQKVIDDLERDYRSLVRQQRLIFAAVGITAASLFLVAGFLSSNRSFFLLPACAISVLVPSAFVALKIGWVAALAIEALAVVRAWAAAEQLPAIAWLLVQGPFAVLLGMWLWSSCSTAQFPAQIEHLKGLKYRAKLA
jgi:hypothetical protein